MAESVAYNMDCMEYMKSVPDKYFDLCICDPPYGDGSSQTVNVERERERERERRWNRFGGRFDRYKENELSTGGRHGKDTYWLGDTYRGNLGGEVRKKIVAWDVAPGKEIFDEIFRVSRDQIIFGANYFPNMPPTRCFLVWRKLSISESFSMAMAEYAWTSFDANAKVYECAPQGKANDPRFHPTAKPIDLYRWIYGLFTKPGMKVYDPFLGSGSSRIAAYESGLDFVGTEIDPIYFAKEEERFERMTNNYSLFD